MVVEANIQAFFFYQRDTCKVTLVASMQSEDAKFHIQQRAIAFC